MNRNSAAIAAISLTCLAACSTGGAREPDIAMDEPPPATGSPVTPPLLTRTEVDSAEALEKLKNARGMTLQWISWDYMGPVAVSDNSGVIRISASQSARTGDGKASMLGDIVRITDNEFIFRGRITIIDTPDTGRECVLDSATAGDQTFAITQNRPYWRLRNFEWCDGLTDYVDIYF